MSQRSARLPDAELLDPPTEITLSQTMKADEFMKSVARVVEEVVKPEFDQIKKRFDSVEGQISAVEKRVVAVEHVVTAVAKSNQRIEEHLTKLIPVAPKVATETTPQAVPAKAHAEKSKS